MTLLGQNQKPPKLHPSHRPMHFLAAERSPRLSRKQYYSFLSTSTGKKKETIHKNSPQLSLGLFLLFMYACRHIDLAIEISRYAAQPSSLSKPSRAASILSGVSYVPLAISPRTRATRSARMSPLSAASEAASPADEISTASEDRDVEGLDFAPAVRWEECGPFTLWIPWIPEGP